MQVEPSQPKQRMLCFGVDKKRATKHRVETVPVRIVGAFLVSHRRLKKCGMNFNPRSSIEQTLQWGRQCLYAF